MNLSLFFWWSSLYFCLILFIVVLSVFIFTSFYLSGEPSFKYFFFVFLVFILRMVRLLLAKSPLYLVVRWDLLGVSSFFLVLFYNNWDRVVGRVNVALTNRIGDFLFFFLVSFFFCSGLFVDNYYYFFWWSYVLVAFVGFTKRAQFPFSRWLPKAISAPTPVRALVHRRTLVTAGMVLIFSFSPSIFNFQLSFVLSFFGIFTIFFSRVCALLEPDMKKVVALSTLSQMGFSCLILGLCLPFFCYFHLLSHALFKSCLFIQVGFFLYSSFGNQDGRGFNFNVSGPFFIHSYMLLTLFCLCGLFFTGGLVRKDLFLELFCSLSFSLLFFFFFFFSVFFTFFYSFRLWRSLFNKTGSSVFYYSKSRCSYFFGAVLFFLSVSFVWYSSKNFFFLPLFVSHLGHQIPLFFFFLFFFFYLFLFRVFHFIFSNSFLVDFFAKAFSFFVFSFKYSEFFQNKTLSLFFGSFSFSGGVFHKQFFFFNIVPYFFLLFFFLTIFWGFIFKNISFARRRVLLYITVLIFL